MTTELDVKETPDFRRMLIADAVRWLAEHGEPADPRTDIDTASLKRRFPHLAAVETDDIRVPRAALDKALAELDPAVRAALEESIRRLRATSEAELEHDVTSQVAPGATVTHRKVPIDRVGLYVPGGLAPLVSSVVMNMVPVTAMP